MLRELDPETFLRVCDPFLAGSGTVNERSQTVHTPITGIVPIHLTTRRFRCRIRHILPHFAASAEWAFLALEIRNIQNYLSQIFRDKLPL
jgi:hypothetical protein